MKKIFRNTIQTACLICLLTIIGAAQTSAATFTVNSTSDPGDGTCDQMECTLREAIAAANASATNEVIVFDPTVFATAQTITLGGNELSIANNGSLTINGPGAKLLTISGNNASRVFYVDSGANATINGLSITKGNGSGAGYNTCGGGVFLSNASLTLNNSDVYGNSVPPGSICNDGSGLLIRFGGTINVNNSTVRDNKGGAGFNNYGTVNVYNSTISNNTGVYGGGIDSFGGMVNLFNVTISGNTGNYGAGIRANGAYFNIRNTIIANSNGLDCNTNNVDRLNIQNSLFEDGSCGVTSGVNGNLTGDPKLGPLADNGGPTMTHALLSDSPAIDAGNDCVLTANGCGNGNAALTTDQRGGHRKYGLSIDIGAFEEQPLIYDSCDFTLIPSVFKINSTVKLAISNCKDQYGNPYTPQRIDYYVDYQNGSKYSLDVSGGQPYSIDYMYTTPGDYTIKVLVDDTEAYSNNVNVGYDPVLQDYDVTLSPSGTLYDSDTLTITLSNFKDQFGNAYTPTYESVKLQTQTLSLPATQISSNKFEIVWGCQEFCVSRFSDSPGIGSRPSNMIAI